MFLWLTLFYFKMRWTNFDPFWFHNSVKLQATETRWILQGCVIIKDFQIFRLTQLSWLAEAQPLRASHRFRWTSFKTIPAFIEKRSRFKRGTIIFIFNTDKENMSEQKLQREPLKSTGNILGSQAQQIRTKMESMPSETKVRWFVRILKWCALMVNYGIQFSNVL